MPPARSFFGVLRLLLPAALARRPARSCRRAYDMSAAYELMTRLKDDA